MNINVNPKAVAFFGFAVVLVSAGGTLAYQASVHEQNCLSYERQMSGGFDNLLSLANKSLGIMEMIKANPFSAFGLVGEITSIKPQVDAQGQKLNDLKYAYVKVCGQSRFDNKVVPAMAPKNAQLTSITDKIRLYSF
jgi:hypothetical protein